MSYIWWVLPAYITLSFFIGLGSVLLTPAHFFSAGFHMKAMLAQILLTAILWPTGAIFGSIQFVGKLFAPAVPKVPEAWFNAERDSKNHLLQILSLYERRQKVFEDYVRVHGDENELQRIMLQTQIDEDNNLIHVPRRVDEGGTGRHPVGWTKGKYW